MSDRPTFFEIAEQLDTLIPLQTPTPKQMEEMMRLVEDEALERYFFRHLATSGNLGWFEPLRQRGFFDTPPEPIEREGAISYPRWPALWYLVAIAPDLPEKVVEVAEQIRTRNLFVMLDLVRAAWSMPPVQAVRMVPLIVRWADEGMKVEESAVSLATYLAQKDQWEAALALVNLILSTQEQQVSEEAKQSSLFFPRAVSKAESYFVQKFVERDLAFFIEHRPLEVLRIVQRNLERAVEIEERDGRDLSWIWRPAIEPHEQNWGFGEIKDLLVGAAVQTLSAVVRSVPGQGRTILEAYLDHHYSIFRRLAIHTIRLNADLWPDLLEHLFTDRKYLEDTEVYHEYWMLMHDVYDSLPASVRNSFVERLLNKLLQKQRYPLLELLWAIRDSISSDEHRMVLEELKNEYGEPDYPSFLSYSSKLVVSVSPKTPEELSKMPPEEILVELRKELPFEGFGEPDQHGLADVMKAAVASTPQHFAPIAPDLLGPDIPRTYTHHALWGFREAWKEGKPFDWEPVLELCDKVSRTSEEAHESGKPLDMSPGYWRTTYASARSAIADLLEAGVVRDDNAIPHRFLDQVRDILIVLTDDPNPSPEYERKWGIEHPSGILGLALNVTRGKAVEGLMHYALHIARVSAQEQKAVEVPFPPGSRMEGVVKDKLTEKLDKQADPSLAVHSLFGQYFPNLHYLDREWVVAHLEDIFPRRPEMSAYWEAAWDGYLFRSDFFGYLYEILKPYYRYAIEQMALGTQGKARSDLSRMRLARHLALVYWHGIETLEGDDSLTPLFFDSAPDEIRAEFVAGLGAALREVKPSADSEEWLRVRALWEARVRTVGEIVEREGHLTGFIKELGAFTDWVPFIPEDFENFYPMIEVSALASENGAAIRLLEFLSSVAEDHAAFVVSLLEKLLQQERAAWFLATESDEVRTILEVAMSSGDEQARSCAVRVINLFGERGDERYRGLLKLK